jgi:hypothetical protein
VRGHCHALAAIYPPERPGTHCTGGTKQYNATKKSHLLVPQLVQESQVTYYFIQYLIQCTKSTLKLFFEHPLEQEFRYTSFKDENTATHDTEDECDSYWCPVIRENC